MILECCPINSVTHWLASQRRRGSSGTFADAQAILGGNDNVIEHFDPQQPAGLGQLFGDAMIFAARSRITAGMIVHQQDCRRRVTNRRSKHFARMHETCVEGPNGDAMVLDRFVFRVERDDVKLFLPTVGG